MKHKKFYARVGFDTDNEGNNPKATELAYFDSREEAESWAQDLTDNYTGDGRIDHDFWQWMGDEWVHLGTTAIMRGQG